ncbi:MAG: hypothetical protein M3R55_13715 [Acidobacteriota bacterium]|nr:hypothetical protein [Acidobacteriota bacterium]
MFRLALAVHLACAFGATAVFWIPILADKGGPLHIKAGRFYARLIYLTAITGTPLAVLLYRGATDLAGVRTAYFLGYLLLILVMPVYHGVRVVRARAGRMTVASPFHTALALSAIAAGAALGVAAASWREWPYVLLSPIGPILGVRALLYARRARTGEPLRWREEHIVAMVMSGIAVHTALLVFGATRTLAMTMTGAGLYALWLLPALVGLPLLVRLVLRERAALTR